MPVSPQVPSTNHSGAHRLGPHVVGQRIVVRRRLPRHDGQPGLTDVLGVCTAWGEGRCVLIKDDGAAVEIPLGDIVAGKPVPPRPSVRARVPARDIELLVGSLWDGQRSVAVGDWMLRAAAPYAGRLPRRGNSMLAIGDPGCSFDEAGALALAHYKALGQEPLAQILADSREERGLIKAGWASLEARSTQCQLASVAQALRACGPRRRGLRTVLTPQEAGDHLRAEVTGNAVRAASAVAGDWLGIHAVQADPDHRRHGWATTAVAELLDWGASQGATTAWLHVETDNRIGLAFWESLGFRTHHSLRYLHFPASCGS